MEPFESFESFEPFDFAVALPVDLVRFLPFDLERFLFFDFERDFDRDFERDLDREFLDFDRDFDRRRLEANEMWDVWSTILPMLWPESPVPAEDTEGGGLAPSDLDSSSSKVHPKEAIEQLLELVNESNAG